MKYGKFIVTSLLASVCWGTAQASVITLDFEGVGNYASVDDFYNGGTDSEGNSGVNYGASFVGGSLALVDSDAGGSGNFANEPSADTILFFLDDSAVLNYAAGFDTGFSFFYTSSKAAQVDLWSGLDKTGDLIGSIFLNENYQDNGCAGDPGGTFCNWDIAGLAFTGTAMSIDFGGTANQVGYDDITFGSAVPVSAVPVPAALFLFAPALLGFFGFRRKMQA